MSKQTAESKRTRLSSEFQTVNQKLFQVHRIYIDKNNIYFIDEDKTLTSKRNFQVLFCKWIDKYSSAHIIDSLDLIQPYKLDASDSELSEWVDYFLDRLPRISHWKYKIGDGGPDVEHLSWCLKNNHNIERYERTKIFLILKHALLEGVDKSHLFKIAATVSTADEAANQLEQVGF